MPSEHFYTNLAPLTSFSEVLKTENHQPVPADWYVAITDVIDSTKSIENGLYKDVNTAGGLAAMAISNVNKGLDFPFIFGGDGISCLIPPTRLSAISDVLYDTRLKVKTFYNLDLRVGLIPVKELYDAGYTMAVGKLQSSAYYNQAIISGDALVAAEGWLKQSGAGKNYLISKKNDASIEADFTGFTCRWKDIPSTKGETISTIIQIQPDQDAMILAQILDQLYAIFGKEEDFHPVTAQNMQISLAEKELGREAQVFSGTKKGLQYWLHLMQYKIQAFFTLLALRFGLKIQANWYDLRKLKDYQIASSDYKKFDGSLKIVINCSTAARKQWQNYLESLHQNKAIYYGIHIADRAIMTCLMHAGSEREVHFIDAADGGYALAAKQMKAQMKA